VSSPTQCPDPSTCSWQPRKLDDVEIFVCTTCGQVRMDKGALDRLTAADPGATTDPVGGPVAGRIPIPGPMGSLGSSDTPSPPADRDRFGDGTRPTLTPGAPPRRDPTPRPTEVRPGSDAAYTVVPFAADHEDSDAFTGTPAPPVRTPVPTQARDAQAKADTGPRPAEYAPPGQRRPSPPPPPPPDVRTVTPRQEAPPSELRAAPLPLAHELKARTQPTWAPEDMPTTVDAGSARRNAIDDSRIPTEERPQPEPVRGPAAPPAPSSDSGQDGEGELGLRAAITRGEDDPGLDLSAAVTRYDEPDLGLFDEEPTEESRDAFLAEEEGDAERFFTDEAPKPGYADDDDEGPLFGPGADVEDDEVTWERRRSPLPMIALVAVILILVVGAVSVAALAVVPDLRAQLGLGGSPAATTPDGPDLATLDEAPTIAEPEAETEPGGEGAAEPEAETEPETEPESDPTPSSKPARRLGTTAELAPGEMATCLVRSDDGVWHVQGCADGLHRDAITLARDAHAAGLVLVTLKGG